MHATRWGSFWFGAAVLVSQGLPRLAVGAEPAAVAAAEPAACKATVTLEKKKDDEERDVLAATVASEGKPVAGVTVTFATPRTFGSLPLGKAETDEQGVATLRFPRNLPGNAQSGELTITAVVTDSEAYTGATSGVFAGGITLSQTPESFPRAIWSPKTDLHLLFTIPVLLGLVWSVYAFSIGQLLKIFRLRRSS